MAVKLPSLLRLILVAAAARRTERLPGRSPERPPLSLPLERLAGASEAGLPLEPAPPALVPFALPPAPSQPELRGRLPEKRVDKYLSPRRSGKAQRAKPPRALSAPSRPPFRLLQSPRGIRAGLEQPPPPLLAFCQAASSCRPPSASPRACGREAAFAPLTFAPNAGGPLVATRRTLPGLLPGLGGERGGGIPASRPASERPSRSRRETSCLQGLVVIFGYLAV